MGLAPLSPEVRREVCRLAAQGRTYRQIAEEVGVSQGAITKITRPLGGVFRREMWEPQPGRLSLEDRVEIKLGLGAGESFASLGRRLGWATSTISREVGGRSGRVGYAPAVAHRRAMHQARRPKPTRLGANAELCARVAKDLERLWSPEQISRRLRDEFPDDPEMWVSHETIYKTLFVQGRGELRRELARCLRTGRARLRPQGRHTAGRIADMINISERPAEVEDRAVPGHWEGDLIIGKNNRSAIGTLVERTTRYVILLHLTDQKATTVRDAMTAAIQALPADLARSVTWDQGNEMAEHAQFTIDTGLDVFFCDPHSPWQRGSNENTNGLLRQYFPKGTDLSVHTPAVLDAVAASLNGRPRKTLDWMTPLEKIDQLVATTG